MIFSTIRLQEIRDFVIAGDGREVIDSTAREFGPLREPMDAFVILAPNDASTDAAGFGLILQEAGYRLGEHVALQSFREAGVPTDGLPESGIFIATKAA